MRQEIEFWPPESRDCRIAHGYWQLARSRQTLARRRLQVYSHAGATGAEVEVDGALRPQYDIMEVEANYKRSMEVARPWLEDDASVPEAAELWYLMGPFYNCPARQRVGYELDGGTHASPTSCQTHTRYPHRA